MFYVFRAVSYLNTLKLRSTLKLGNRLRFSTTSCKTAGQDALKVNTNVSRDVILFKYENPRYYKYLSIFGASQLMFWTYMAYVCITSLRDSPVVNPSKEDWWFLRINWGEDKYRFTFAGVSFFMGTGILLISWLYTLHSVRYVVLRQGGKSVTLVTYTPLGENRMVTVPLEHVSSEQTRHDVKVQLPIKVKKHLFFYMLDAKGEFRNALLYDTTVGLRRPL